MIFLIMQAWVDPLENREDFGYDVVGYVNHEETAKKICREGGDVPFNATWSLSWKDPQPWFKYKTVKFLYED